MMYSEWEEATGKMEGVEFINQLREGDTPFQMSWGWVDVYKFFMMPEDLNSFGVQNV